MPLIGLVTPADENSPSYTAFQDELVRLGQANAPQIYKASVYGSIEAAAVQAVKDVPKTGVLVAAGEMAAYYVQDETSKKGNQVPIILAFGGDKPSNVDSPTNPTNKNMTGFIGKCETVAKQHLAELKKTYYSEDITVLYDADPDMKNHITQKILKELTKDLKIKPRGIDTANVQQDLIDTPLATRAVMMIPNAVFFTQADDITAAVDNTAVVEVAYYPEFHYWNKSHGDKHKAKVSGYNVPLTYREAALWVDHLLTGYWTLNDIVNLSKRFAEAIPDPYPYSSSLSTARRSSGGRRPRRVAE